MTQTEWTNVGMYVSAAYCDLYVRYRGLLAALARRNLLGIEYLEDEIEEWMKQEGRAVAEPALEAFQERIGRIKWRQAEPSPEPPSA